MSDENAKSVSLSIIDPDLIARLSGLDRLSPEEMERLSSILEVSLKELR